MALINCPNCGAQISDRAPQCPHCGYQPPSLPDVPNAPRRGRAIVWVTFLLLGIVIAGAIALYFSIESRKKARAEAANQQEIAALFQQAQQEKVRRDSIEAAEAIVAEAARRQDSIVRVNSFKANLLKPSEIFWGSVRDGFTAVSPSQLLSMLEQKGYALVSQEEFATTYMLSIDNGSEQYCKIKVNHWNNDLIGIELEYDSSQPANEFFKATRPFQDPGYPGTSTVRYIAGFEGWQVSKDSPRTLSIYFNPGD